VEGFHVHLIEGVFGCCFGMVMAPFPSKDYPL
jgi:hypothetical protein